MLQTTNCLECIAVSDVLLWGCLEGRNLAGHRMKVHRFAADAATLPSGVRLSSAMHRRKDEQLHHQLDSNPFEVKDSPMGVGGALVDIVGLGVSKIPGLP